MSWETASELLFMKKIYCVEIWRSYGVVVSSGGDSRSRGSAAFAGASATITKSNGTRGLIAFGTFGPQAGRGNRRRKENRRPIRNWRSKNDAHQEPSARFRGRHRRRRHRPGGRSSDQEGGAGRVC